MSRASLLRRTSQHLLPPATLAAVIVALGVLVSLRPVGADPVASVQNPNPSQIQNAYRGVTQDRSAHSPDEALFVEKCGMCHRQMGMGTVLLGRRVAPQRAILEHRTDLTPALIAVAVRQGLGNMPRLSRGEVSDPQLARISAYLTHPKTRQTP